jgi:hypothetical protein
MRKRNDVWKCYVILGVSAVLALALPLPVTAEAAQNEVVIRADGLDPHVRNVVMGERVNFVKRVGDPVHVEFGDDIRQHQVFQMPLTGPISATFYRPGTHPYVVHIYGSKGTTALHGVIEVVEDPAHPWALGVCGAVVMEECIEP